MPTPAAFDPEQVNLALERVAGGLWSPVFLTHVDDNSGRLFILERAGTIRILADGALLSTPFLDLRDRVGSEGLEQGLLGLAFDPNYRANGLFFVYYTGLRDQTVLSRFRITDDPNVADPASETVVLTVDQPARNHNGGMIAFGPDGFLYVGLGDGGAANDRFGNGQNQGTLLGALLRLDVAAGEPYAVPEDNPFLGVAGARPELWAYGLRNPWRFSFDRATGDLYIADVGQNQYEEVHVQPANSPGGENYGWPIMESFHCFQRGDCSTAGLQLPVTEYDHSQGCSITGGYVYRGAAYPSLNGAYFYGDYCSGRIWALSRGANGRWVSHQMLETGLSISSFGEDQAGELYVLDLNGGAAYRLVDRGISG
jgi:glucose/arabinose dehydrogenase